MYALILAEDGRILSATYPMYAPADAVIVDALPDGDISEYLYVNGQYIHDAIISPDGGGDVPPDGGGSLVQWSSIVGKPGYLTEAGINDLIDEKLGDSGGASIIDVVELPTEDIREDCFYRLLSGSVYYSRTPQGNWTCLIVDSLPEEGLPVTTDMEHMVLYYAVDTAAVSGYINSVLSGAVGVPSGWYPAEVLAQAFDVGWGGIIWNEAEAPADEMYRLVLSYAVYQFKNGWYNLSDKVGWRGTAVAGSEIFNSLSSIASGNYSHAEGDSSHAEGFGSHAEGSYSHAEGDSSHAEGHVTHAEGSYSHAEGNHSHAKGDSSHAEGHVTHAEGNYSHAEGSYSHAEGLYSHAEGDSSHAEGFGSHAEGSYSHAEGSYSHAEGSYSHAVGVCQHVQGEHNIIDPEYDPNRPNSRAKYAHIVGNGIGINMRSNAHTLDWSGNAWFQGSVYVGGIGQDDEAAVKLATVDDVQNLIDTKLGVIENGSY